MQKLDLEKFKKAVEQVQEGVRVVVLVVEKANGEATAFRFGDPRTIASVCTLTALQTQLGILENSKVMAKNKVPDELKNETGENK